jgi:hypothetical protein
MIMLSEKSRITKVLTELKKLRDNYKKRKNQDKDTMYVLNLLVSEYESALITLEMVEKL